MYFKDTNIKVRFLISFFILMLFIPATSVAEHRTQQGISSGGNQGAISQRQPQGSSYIPGIAKKKPKPAPTKTTKTPKIFGEAHAAFGRAVGRASHQGQRERNVNSPRRGTGGRGGVGDIVARVAERNPENYKKVKPVLTNEFAMEDSSRFWDEDYYLFKAGAEAIGEHRKSEGKLIMDYANFRFADAKGLRTLDSEKTQALKGFIGDFREVMKEDERYRADAKYIDDVSNRIIAMMNGEERGSKFAGIKELTNEELQGLSGDGKKKMGEDISKLMYRSERLSQKDRDELIDAWNKKGEKVNTASPGGKVDTMTGGAAAAKKMANMWGAMSKKQREATKSKLNYLNLMGPGLSPFERQLAIFLRNKDKPNTVENAAWQKKLASMKKKKEMVDMIIGEKDSKGKFSLGETDINTQMVKDKLWDKYSTYKDGKGDTENLSDFFRNHFKDELGARENQIRFAAALGESTEEGKARTLTFKGQDGKYFNLNITGDMTKDIPVVEHLPDGSSLLRPEERDELKEEGILDNIGTLTETGVVRSDNEEAPEEKSEGDEGDEEKDKSKPKDEKKED